MTKPTSHNPQNTAQTGMKLVIILGLVSLFADMTYESARSISGPFMALLGAGATAVGIVAGAGDLLGYGLRYFSGRWADQSHRYWLLTGFILVLLHHIFKETLIGCTK